MSACAGSTGRAIFDAIADHGVTHLCGAPIVMGMLVNAPDEQRRAIAQGAQMMTAGAAPPAAVIERHGAHGLRAHPCLRPDRGLRPATWSAPGRRSGTRCRSRSAPLQGAAGRAAIAVLEGLMVADPATLKPVPRDGATIGEIMHARQRGHEGLPEEPDRHRRRPSRAAGSTPATSA